MLISIGSMHFLLILILFISSVSSQTKGLASVSWRLRRELFSPSRYDRFNEPHARNRSGQTLYMKLLALHVLIDENVGSMKVNGHIFMMWNDYRIRWRPEDYEGVDSLSVMAYYLWKPELSIFNDVHPRSYELMKNSRLTVLSNGTVYRYAPINLETSCLIDLKYYPFDEHHCPVDIGSWTAESGLNYSVHYAQRYHEEEVLEEFSSPNPLWEVFERKDEVIKRKFDCCPGAEFPFYQLRVGIRRKAPFYKFLLVTPSVVSTLLTLAVFWIPVEGHSNARITVGAIATTTLFLVIIHLAYYMPSVGKTIPAIASFCGVSLVMSTLTFVMSIGIMKINRLSQTSEPLPDFIKNILRLFSKFKLLQFGHSQSWAKFSNNGVDSNSHNKDDHGGSDSVQVEISGQSAANSAVSINRDWIDVGIVLDRLCFIIYSFVFICIFFLLIFS